MRGGLAYCIDNHFRCMTENCRSPTANVLDVFLSIDIPNSRALGARHQKRLAAHVTKCANRRVDATRDALLRAREKFGRTRRHYVEALVPGAYLSTVGA